MSIVRARKLVVGLVALAALTCAGPALASTASFNVQTTADGNQSSPGSTSCATISDSGTQGKCTLRSTIEAASNEPQGTDVTINVPAGTYKLTVANPLCSQRCSNLSASSYSLNIPNGPNSITVAGAGAATTIVDANFLDRAFNISSGPRVTISGLTVEHGRPGGIGNVSDCPTTISSEADGGGISTSGDLILTDDVLTDNIAAGAGGGLVDGGDGTTLTISGTTISDNKACQPTSGGLRGGGGISITIAATTNISSSVITGNTALPNGNGGGITTECCQGAAGLQIASTTISDNRAFDGGGVASDGGGVNLLFADTLSGNQASNNGGAFEDGSGGTDRFVDSTFDANTAGADGGGIWEVGTGTVSFSTLVGNTSTSGTGNLSVGAESNGTFSIDDSIAVGAGPSGNCNTFGFTDNGYNLFDDTSDHGAQCGSGAGKHDIITSDPKLGSLANNGGLTETVALLSGSPAVDTASDSLCRTEPVPPSLPVARDGLIGGTPVDQRYVTRPQGPHCDIGAFEATPDVGVSGSVAKDPIFVGQQDTVTWVVGNSNPSDAENATFTDPAAGYTIDSATPSQGSCSHTATTLTCHLGLIPPGGHVTIKVVITGQTPGKITLNGKTATTGSDLNQANNHATVQITVKKKKKTPPPPPPPPPKPHRPVIVMNHLGPGCHVEQSTLHVVATATAKAGIHTFTVKIDGQVVKKFSSRSKSDKHRTLVVHVKGSLFVAGRTYTVVAQVVDSLGRGARVERHFTMCKPKKKQGFTG